MLSFSQNLKWQSQETQFGEDMITKELEPSDMKV